MLFPNSLVPDVWIAELLRMSVAEVRALQRSHGLPIAVRHGEAFEIYQKDLRAYYAAVLPEVHTR